MKEASPITTGVKALIQAYRTMSTARAMSDLYEANARLTSRYVHACARGHEAIQWATGRLLENQDYLSAYYRDDCLLLTMGMEPEELMLQLLAKGDDPFSGGRTYYSHPSLNRVDLPRIPHQSSATGMQAIPAAGVALGLQYKEIQGIPHDREGAPPVVVCSIGDAAMTEGEVSEALHMSDLRQLPIIWLVQDNEWDISAHASEIRSHDASTLAKAFPQIKLIEVDGANAEESMHAMNDAFEHVRSHRSPVMVHAHVPLLGHHTSGVRKEWYRDDLKEHEKRDPLRSLRDRLVQLGIDQGELDAIQKTAVDEIQNAFDRAQQHDEPDPNTLAAHVVAPTDIVEETGQRTGTEGEMTLMV